MITKITQTCDATKATRKSIVTMGARIVTMTARIVTMTATTITIMALAGNTCLKRFTEVAILTRLANRGKATGW